jgi:hypothetical protein
MELPLRLHSGRYRGRMILPHDAALSANSTVGLTGLAVFQSLAFRSLLPLRKVRARPTDGLVLSVPRPAGNWRAAPETPQCPADDWCPPPALPPRSNYPGGKMRSIPSKRGSPVPGAA